MLNGASMPRSTTSPSAPCFGNATLYLRFPTREDLVAAVFVDRLAEYADAAATSLQMPDPWTASVRSSNTCVRCRPMTTEHAMC